MLSPDRQHLLLNSQKQYEIEQQAQELQEAMLRKQAAALKKQNSPKNFSSLLGKPQALTASPQSLAQAALPSKEDRTLAPTKIGASHVPHLSPVGSLTNLLTDLSSTGWLQSHRAG